MCIIIRRFPRACRHGFSDGNALKKVVKKIEPVFLLQSVMFLVLWANARVVVDWDSHFDFLF